MLAHAAGAVVWVAAFLVTATCAQSQSKDQAQIRACGGPAKTHTQCLKVCECLQGKDCARYCDSIYRK
jgi:citrate lyase synthetase